MLIYDQALDPYHSAIRILAIASSSTERHLVLTIDAARIADYFLVYPYKMISFTFPAEFRTMRAFVSKSENPYRQALGNRAAFERMRPIFFAAISGLVASNLIDSEGLKRGVLAVIANEIPADLSAAVARFHERQTAVGEFVLSDLLTIPVNGDNGLKHRSNLIEHRYDIA